MGHTTYLEIESVNIRRDKEFIEFLVKKFFDENPEPDKEIRKIFTRILHYHNTLVWLCPFWEKTIW